jgi:phage terminase large subunit
MTYHGPEAILHGPAETGKSFAALWKLHLCAQHYPGASIVIMRKTLSSAYASVLQTFIKKVLGPDEENWRCKRYGGEKPEWFNYNNGSRIWVAGMDKSTKILSAEHDIIFVNQVEELSIEEWETLTTRTTGRAGNMPYAQTLGDCNPAWPSHWFYHRQGLRLFYSKHTDNPNLFDQKTGEPTEQGQRTLASLGRLTGSRRQRLLLGLPARPEGVVLEEWDDALHYVYRDSVPHLERYVAGVDWGYTNPGVIAVYGLDYDGRMYLVEEIYRLRRTDDWWLEQALELHRRHSVPASLGKPTEHRIEAWVCDPSEPAYIQKFRNAGLSAVKAFNGVLPGITAVKQRLADNRLFISRDALRQADPELEEKHLPLCTHDEIQGYVWADTKSKEVPIKENDHGVDQLRYAVCYVDRIGEEARKVAKARAL